MIKTLEVNNFKSIKDLSLNCKRINIFIGKPNTGKSNILETLGIFSYGRYGQSYGARLNNFVRFERMTNLFYDEILDANVEIKFDDKALEVTFKDGRFEGKYREKEKDLLLLRGGYDDITPSSVSDLSPLSPFKFYRFTVKKAFPERESAFLLPPSGKNLLSVLLTHKELKSLASQIFEPFGLKLVFKPQENRIEVLKQYEDIFISHPYSLTSDTLQRLVFYLTAIESNKDSFLAFEEPESHAFPYYTKYLAEVIALDTNNNQYFISTHNPEFLLSILEKSPKEDVAVFITYYENYQTKVKPLGEKQLEEAMEIDVFFNIERYLEEK
jgi:AAA15 family ATPase/GTPase